VNSKDYYALLGVPAGATRSAVRRAFQKLARKYHPDLNPGDNVAAVRYRRIFEAFEVLTDPEARERYDRGGPRPEEEAPREPVRYGFEGFDFTLEGERRSDIFARLFEPDRPASGRGQERGEDIHHRIAIRFEDSLNGLAASFRIARSLVCATCEGYGEIPSADPATCAACEGRGRTMQVHGFMLFAKPCRHCRGAGKLARERCPDCLGAGSSARAETIEVEIPPGIVDGERIVITGRGHEGRGSRASGDLYVHVQVHPHPLFSRQGDNLYYVMPVSFTEAALGSRIEVPTLLGPVTLRVPAGVQSGQRLRLSGRGAPSRRSAARGDLFVVIKVVTPRVYDDRSRELLRELDRLNPLEERVLQPASAPESSP
jgi:molecular chaperone DnaJ